MWENSFCGWGSSFGHGPWFFGWLFPLLFWGHISYLAFSVIHHFFFTDQSAKSDGALDILRNRFAAGEISEQEYQAQKSVLQGS